MFESAFNNIDREHRNEKRLASNLEYAEQTSWILFFKYLEDIEQERQDEADLGGRDYAFVLVKPNGSKLWWRLWLCGLLGRG
ncbi:hypothetical protein [Yoonia sp. TsM2_T14_4]|uniref:hypothetical protein n=1 Tax=Yoonia sp. TsM2_T14_4 TaxID=3415141 RepID=UPI003C7245E4